MEKFGQCPNCKSWKFLRRNKNTRVCLECGTSFSEPIQEKWYDVFKNP